MSTCRSCGAPIRWAETANGKAMPLDAEPTAAGNVRLLVGRGDHGEDLAEVLVGAAALQEAQAAGEDLHVSHFATCPHGRAWRRS